MNHTFAFHRRAAFGAVMLIALLAGMAPRGVAAEGTADPRPNELSGAEKAEGWRLLFDGSTSNGWRGFKLPGFPAQGWSVEEGWLKVHAHGHGGDLITVDQFDDFDLRFEWRVTPGANSGVKYFITEDRPGKSGLGHEYQLIDDERHLDALRGPKWQTAALYDLFPAHDRPVRPAGEVNQSRILVHANHVEHWLNGVKVLEYELGSESLKQAIAASKFKNVAGFGTKFKSHILLQEHGDEVWFRNLKLRELPAP